MKKENPSLLCCGFTPCIQRMLHFERFEKRAVNRAKRVETGVGGKGANTARVLRQLGADPLLAGFAGGANGDRLERMLADEGVRFRHVRTRGETRICQTLLERGDPETTELVEEMPPLAPQEWEEMIALLESWTLDGVVIAAGKLPAGAPEEAYAWIAQKTARDGGRLLLDAPGLPLLNALKHAPALVKMNDSELFATLGRECDISEGCAELLERGAQAVLITRGGRSAFFVQPGQKLEIFPPRIQAVNPVGSGDAVSAGIAFEWLKRAGFAEALRTGMACGASNALHVHCGVVHPDEVAALREEVRIEPQ